MQWALSLMQNIDIPFQNNQKPNTDGASNSNMPLNLIYSQNKIQGWLITAFPVNAKSKDGKFF